MLSEALEELKNAIAKSHEALKRELSKIRTGRANPDLLDAVRVNYYGSATPLKQLGSITVPEARMLMVKPFDKTAIGSIEKAIMQAGLNLNPANDGEVLRIPMPPLTEELRRSLTKVARAKGEECRVGVRSARHDCKDMIDALQSDGDVGADDADRARKEMEEIVKKGNGVVDELVSKKESDIMEV